MVSVCILLWCGLSVQSMFCGTVLYYVLTVINVCYGTVVLVLCWCSAVMCCAALACYVLALFLIHC